MHTRKNATGWLMPLSLLALLLALAGSAVAQVPLNPKTLTKFIDPLPVPGAMPMAGPNYYEIGAYQIQQKLHTQLPPTTVFGYGTSQATASYPGATIVARKGVPISIKWTNHLPPTHPLAYAFDPTIPAAHTTTGIPIATHVHGCEVEPQSDGGPMTWFTPGFAEKGDDWKKQVLAYPNSQLPATIWYHDHAFGYTRHNVYAGLAGFFVITDPGHEPAGLPSAPYDIGLAIQDRMFLTNGQLWYPNVGITPTHPIWMPEFFGDVILVNGKVWPYLNVEARKYRFRILEGSQARFYSLSLANRRGGRGPAFYQIATDGGYLAKPVLLNDPKNASSPQLLIAPGERAEVIIDFSAYAPGTEFILNNMAKAPYPAGAPADPQTTGQIMLFRVVARTSPDNSVIPANLVTVNRITNPTKTRVMTLNEMIGAGGPVEMFLNGMPFHGAPETETPVLGTTEMWEIVNLTADTHPIHLHLVQFQLLNRQKVDVKKYTAAFTAANAVVPATTYVPVAPGLYLAKGKAVPPDPNEMGWKDTFRMNPGEVTRILVRWAPQDGSPAFAFDATAEPGYVWHCHILEHEENDMMRPYHLVAPAVPVATKQAGSHRAAPETVIGETVLFAPYPNPAQRGSTMRFALRAPGQVDLGLYDVAGHRVRQIARGSFPAGEHGIAWDGSDDHGRIVASGVYFLNLRADGVNRTMKMSVMP
jgi:FtsP/CotA-like multicopper oxidase with cupredoxin domain